MPGKAHVIHLTCFEFDDSQAERLRFGKLQHASAVRRCCIERFLTHLCARQCIVLSSVKPAFKSYHMLQCFAVLSPRIQLDTL